MTCCAPPLSSGANASASGFVLVGLMSPFVNIWSAAVENTETTVEVPSFIVNLIGRLVAENEALKAGLIPAQSVVQAEPVDESQSV